MTDAKRSAPPRPRRKVVAEALLDPDLYEWLMARVGPGKAFSSPGHAFECALVRLRRGPALRPRRARRPKPVKDAAEDPGF